MNKIPIIDDDLVLCPKDKKACSLIECYKCPCYVCEEWSPDQDYLMCDSPKG